MLIYIDTYVLINIKILRAALGPYHTENAKKKVKFLLSKNFTFVVFFYITRKAKLKFLLSKNFTFVRVFLYHTEENKKKLQAFPKVSNEDHM